MKLFKGVFSVLVLLALTLIYSCSDDGGGDKETQKETRTNMLTSKDGGWTMSSMTVPAGTVFDGLESDWNGVGVVFSASTMTSSDVPSDGENVWPSSTSWEMNDEGTTVTRGDDVEMTISSISESQVVFTFTLPEGTTIDGRTLSLDGEYTVTLN